MPVHTRTCHICEANCGLLIETEGRRVVSIRGDSDDPISRGHICPKGNAIADLEADPDRLTSPMKRVGEDWVALEWETALAEIGTNSLPSRLRAARQRSMLATPPHMISRWACRPAR